MFAEGVTVLWEDMTEEQLEMGGVIARSVGGEVIAVGQKLKMAGAEIHVHDIMIALAEGAGLRQKPRGRRNRAWPWPCAPRASEGALK